MRPPLFTVSAAGFSFLRRVGRFAKTIGKCQGYHLRIQRVVEARMGACDVCNVAAWAKRVQYIPHIQLDGAFVVQYFFLNGGIKHAFGQSNKLAVGASTIIKSAYLGAPGF